MASYRVKYRAEMERAEQEEKKWKKQRFSTQLRVAISAKMRDEIGVTARNLEMTPSQLARKAIHEFLMKNRPVLPEFSIPGGSLPPLR